MKFFVTVKANAKIPKVEQTDETHFRIAVKEPPREGEANEAVIQALSLFLGKPRSCFKILSGHKSKTKIVGIRTS